MPKDIAYFCPQCGNPAIERSSLAGGAASCKTCPWEGTSDDLHAVPFDHDFLASEEMVARFTSEVATILMQHLGQPLGRVLLKWGFLSPEFIASELPIYGRALAAAVVKSIIETREGLVTGKIQRFHKKPEGQRKGIH